MNDLSVSFESANAMLEAAEVHRETQSLHRRQILKDELIAAQHPQYYPLAANLNQPIHNRQLPQLLE